MSELNPSWMDDDTYWPTRDGRILAIAEMDADHLRNTIAYLRRHEARYRLGRQLNIDAAFGHPGELSDGVYAAWSHLRSEVEAPDWLENLPVMRALKAALENSAAGR